NVGWVALKANPTNVRRMGLNDVKPITMLRRSIAAMGTASLARPTGSRLAQAFADIREGAAGEAAEPVRRRLRLLDPAGLEIRKPGAEFRKLRRREPQDRFFDLFGGHGHKGYHGAWGGQSTAARRTMFPHPQG